MLSKGWLEAFKENIAEAERTDYWIELIPAEAQSILNHISETEALLDETVGVMEEANEEIQRAWMYQSIDSDVGDNLIKRLNATLTKIKER